MISGDSDPIIPEAQQRRALRIINDVNKHVKIMRRFDGRINNLRLFEDFVHGEGRVLTKSRTIYSDHPLVQLLLQRRDRYEELQKHIDQYQKIIDGFTAQDESDRSAKMDAISAVVKMKVQQSKEMEAMEICLTNIRKEMTIHLHTCQKFVTDMVKISQAERMLAKKLGGASEDMSDAFIDAKLAE